MWNIKFFIKGITKRLFSKLSVFFLRRQRRKNRPKSIEGDMDDPYFILRKNIDHRKDIYKFEGKIYLKENIKNILPDIRIAKMYFTFNKKGELVKGTIPKNTTVILKHNRGRGGKDNIIINSDEITKDVLKEAFLKMSRYYDFGDAHWLDVPHYSSFSNICFAEEFLPSSDDYKIMTYGVDNFNYVLNKGRFSKRVDGQFDANFEPTIHYAYSTMPTVTLSKEDIKKFKIASKISNKIYKEVGHFVRVDFYFDGLEPILGEITFIPAFGKYWDHRKTSVADPKKEELYKEINLLKGRE